MYDQPLGVEGFDLPITDQSPLVSKRWERFRSKPQGTTLGSMWDFKNSSQFCQLGYPSSQWIKQYKLYGKVVYFSLSMAVTVDISKASHLEHGVLAPRRVTSTGNPNSSFSVDTNQGLLVCPLVYCFYGQPHMTNDEQGLPRCQA